MKLLSLLQNGRVFFSKSLLDFGQTKLVEHFIKLSDEQPFKEPWVDQGG